MSPHINSVNRGMPVVTSYVFLPCELSLQKIQGVQIRLVLKKMLKNVLKEPDTVTEYLRMPLEVM